MKQFAKRAALVFGLLCTALLCMGIVYIDTIQNFWRVNSGFVQLVVSNSISTITLSTNTPHGFGYNTNNTLTSFNVNGQQRSTNASGNGTSAANTGGIIMTGGKGGGTFSTTTANGGVGGNVTLISGNGGDAPLATTNTTGGAGGAFTMGGGNGGMDASGGSATNSTTGGAGGSFTMSGGGGGIPNVASTNTATGNGGSVFISGGTVTSPTAGWARRTGNGGSVTIAGGLTSTSTRTNSGDGGSVAITAGGSGNVGTAPGNPGTPGAISLIAGNGGTGDTNANGGSVYAAGGTGAITGNVVIGRLSDGTSRGGLQIGPLFASSVPITNSLSATATLDFPSIAAGIVADLPITVANAADGDVVALAVPSAARTNCMWMAFASNGVVYVRAANCQLVTSQDPNSGVFRVWVTKFQ